MKKAITVFMVFTFLLSSVPAAFAAGSIGRGWGNMPQIANGSANGAVRGAQWVLTDVGFSVGGVDGIFGAKTKAAAIKYQAKKKLTKDGIIGKNTWAKMRTELHHYDTGSTNWSYDIVWGKDR